LCADEDLVAGKVYLLVPVSRINSKASEFEIAIAERGSGKRKGNKTAKVSPEAFTLFVKGDGILFWIQFLNPLEWIMEYLRM